MHRWVSAFVRILRIAWQVESRPHLILIGFLFFMSAAVGHGQTAADTPQETIEAVHKKIEALEKRISSSRQSESELKAQQLGVSLEQLSERTQTLEAIRSALERLKTEMEKRHSQAEEAALLKEKLQGAEEIRVTQPPPYNLSFYDSLLDELAATEQQKTAASAALALSKRNSQNLAGRLEKVQQLGRGLNEKIEKNPDVSATQPLKYESVRLDLEQELLNTLISFETVHQENLSGKIELLQLEADIVRHKIEWVVGHLHYDQSDLENHLESIRKRQNALENELQKMVDGRDKTEASLRSARQQLPSAGEIVPKALEAKIRELQTWRETYQTGLEMTAAEIQLLDGQQRLWKTRYSVAEGAVPRAELVGLRKDIDSQVSERGKQVSLEHRRRDAIRSRIGLLEKERDNPETPANLKLMLESTLDALRRLGESHADYISALLQDEQLRLRILEETAPKDEAAGIKDKLLIWAGRLKEIWSVEVWVIDNNSVTVREVIVALLVLVIGIIAVKIVFRAVSNKIFALANIKDTTAATITKIFLYFAYVMVALLALRIVNIPLAAFAFLGGAIAIGVGFGAQNLINNFISGFIMMAERPISIGDLIEVDGIVGKVEDIGARCTRVRTGRNIHILVPNSSFLENNIINWTHSDEKIRTSVTVGVAYGSSVSDTRRLLLQAITETPDIFPSPAPFVIFHEFGDNALIFDVHFWIQVNRLMEEKIIKSNVRFRIDKLFADAGLVIAFPQRDVHLDSGKPLELRIVNPKEPSESE